MARQMSDKDKALIEFLEDQGFKYTAKYVAKFGSDNMNPWFWGKQSQNAESFYKTCVEEGHPWDFYVDAPTDETVL